MKSVIAILAIVLTAGSALGQSSFNIDINNTSGGGAGVPPNTFGGAAGQPGFWNDINPATATALFIGNTSGGFPGTVLTRSTAAFFSSTNLFTSGDFARLMDDGQKPAAGNVSYTFSSLAAGNYAVYTYAVDPGNCGSTVVTLNGSLGFDTQSVVCSIGSSSVNRFVRGGTHSLHLVTVAVGGSITVTVLPNLSSAVCVGFQLKYLGAGGKLRIYVDDSATGANTGTSWADAYTDLQDALGDAKVAGPEHTEVWTATGFYYPDATDESVSFVISSGLKLYGGFAGTETTLDQRGDPAFHITALSGALSGQNSYSVVNADNTSSATLVDGFSIANGDNTGGGSSDGKGGGLHIVNGSAQFRNCKFLSNHANIEGGAVYSTGGSPTFVNCLFFNNMSDGAGGAVYHHTSGDIDFYNCKFDRNHSFGGGAMEISFASGDIYNCLFNGNTSSAQAGAIYIAGAALLTRIGNCTITNNAASQFCGGIYMNQGVNSPINVAISNCIIWGNTDTVSTLETRNISRNGSGTVSVNYSTIEGWDGSFGGTANNGTNPQFVDLNGADNIAGNGDDNPRLISSSPMCDAGDNTRVLNDVPDLNQNGNFSERLPLDLDGNARFVNDPSMADTGVGPAPVVDRGCFEFAFHLGDMDCNNSVNTLDLDDFVQALLNPALYNASHTLCSITLADMNGDGLIDALDIQPFVTCVTGNGCP